MESVKLSPNYQVVIPLRVRRALRLKAGQRFQVIAYDNRIELVPIVPIRKLRGFLKGIDTHIEREEGDRV